MQSQQPLQGLNQVVLILLLNVLRSKASAAHAETLQSCLALLLQFLLALPMTARQCLDCPTAFPKDKMY